MTMPELPNPAPSQPTVPVRPTQQAARRKPAKSTILIAAAGLVIGALLGVAGTLLATSAVAGANAQAEAAKLRVLKAATRSCAVSNNPGAKLGDSDSSLFLNGHGSKDTSGLSDMEFGCVLDAVKVPDYVRAQMEKTRALDGTQRESWGNISATWSYHPDNGLDVGLVEK